MAVVINKKAHTAIFHKIYFKQIHHRNPSGLHNKVRWLLSEGAWDVDKILQKTTDIAMCEMDRKSYDSWQKAIIIAVRIAEGTHEGLKERYPEEWLWIEEFVKRFKK